MTGVVSMALYHCRWLVFGAEIFLFIRFFTLDKHPFIELVGGGGNQVVVVKVVQSCWTWAWGE